MSSTATVADSFTDQVDGTTFTGGSGTYTPDPSTKLILGMTAVMDQGAGSPSQSLTAYGLTWAAFSDGTNNMVRLSPSSRVRGRVFRSTGGTPSTTAPIIDTTGVTCERARFVAVEISESSNANAAQIKTNAATDANATVTFDSAPNAANLLLGFFCIDNTNTSFTAGSGVTVLDDTVIEALMRVVVVTAINQSSLTGTWGVGSAGWIGMIAEIGNVAGAGQPAARRVSRVPIGVKGVRLY